jgi:hypothetical protein
MNDQQKKEQYSALRDEEIRAALDQHWAASDANDFETEHRIYHEDAVLEYPQSGERTRGRANIRASAPVSQATSTLLCGESLAAAIFGSQNSSLRMTASPPTPSASWSSAATRWRGKHSTLRTHSRLPHGALNGWNGWTHSLEVREIR